jgi:hypothetical protein
MKTTRVPEDSVLRRHYMQMQEAGLIPAAENEPAPVQKGVLGRLLDKLFGR